MAKEWWSYKLLDCYTLTSLHSFSNIGRRRSVLRLIGFVIVQLHHCCLVIAQVNYYIVYQLEQIVLETGLIRVKANLRRLLRFWTTFSSRMREISLKSLEANKISLL
jgi:hypothetical protein